MQLSRFDFELSPDCIAQEPADRRDGSRLMIVPRREGPFEDAGFGALAARLRAGDLLVLNDTRVVPVRFPARRQTGALLDVLLVGEHAPGRWTAMIQGGRRIKSGETVLAGRSEVRVTVARTGTADAPWEVDFGATDVASFLGAQGRAPLPPYIRRDAVRDERDAFDRERYQTVFARSAGAIAAPTAGLHFTPELLAALEAAGVEHTRVTLHVGAGTFLPVKVDAVDDHVMHTERYRVTAEAVDAVARTRARGGRVIPVGTTSLRTLEATADGEGGITAGAGSTDLFIRPGYRFRVADGLITNFHLPKSTLFMLVSAMAGLERMQAAYAAAIERGFRFYSYGDAMLIL